MVKIQKQWKSLKIRKLMYKATIRNFWNKNVTQYFFLIAKEKMQEKMGISMNEIEKEKTGNLTSQITSLTNINISPVNAIKQ